MDRQRDQLIRECLEKGGADADEAAYGRLRKRVLALALTPAETVAKAEEVAAAGIAMDRAAFREWMRIQAAAEQGERFGLPPAASIATGA